MNIVLAAFGKRGYFFAAYNLAQSIKVNDPDANILLIHDKGIKALAISELSVFDKFHEIDEATTHPKGIFDAGHVKLKTYRIATKHFRKYMFLDVDALAIKSIREWYDLADKSDKDFLTDVRGVGGIEDTINYSVWAKNEDIWSEFDLDPKKDVYYAVQSSWHFAKRTKANTAMFKDAVELNLNSFEDRTKLLIKWGKALPDELILGGALARRKFDPTFEISPIYFPNKHLPLSELKEKYYILSMFGNGNGATMVKVDFKEFYNRFLLKEVFRPLGLGHKYKNSMVMKDKMIG